MSLQKENRSLQELKLKKGTWNRNYWSFSFIRMLQKQDIDNDGEV